MTRFKRSENGSRFQRTDNGNGATPPKKRGPGRPSNYDPTKHPTAATFLANQFGMTNQHIADAFMISINTLDHWIEDHPEFRQAIKAGRDNWDTGQVETTLLRRAMGYPYTETKVKEVLVEGMDAEGVAVAVPAREVTTFNKTMAPNMTAIIFWLKNRQPERWRDVQAVDITKKTKKENVYRLEMLAGLKIEFDKLKVDDLEKLVEQFQPGTDPDPSGPSGQPTIDINTVGSGAEVCGVGAG